MVALFLMLSCSGQAPWYQGTWQETGATSRLTIDVERCHFEDAAPFPCTVREESTERAVLELQRGQSELWTLEREGAELVVDRGDRRFRFQRLE
ncbi:MAG: hypothetical protein ACI9VR_002890 [Cognaticolwellia sp.]|jgi:hypothetical protein